MKHLSKWLFLIVCLAAASGLSLVVTHAQDEQPTPEPPAFPTETQTSTPNVGLQRPTLRTTGLPTPIPQITGSPTTVLPTNSPVPTNTVTPSATSTATPTLTATATTSKTATASLTTTVINPPPAASVTVTASLTITASPTLTETASPTYTRTATLTPTATTTDTATSTATFTATATATATNTAIPISVTNQGNTPDSTAASGGIDPLILVGVVLLAGLGAYVVLYALNSAAMDRYAIGFPLQQCPVCGGNLEIEERPYRSMGIPRARRTVRCDNCRSVLREVGRKRWRYAVDRNVNPAMVEQFNEKTLSESELQRLAPTTNRVEAPLYVEE